MIIALASNTQRGHCCDTTLIDISLMVEFNRHTNIIPKRILWLRGRLCQLSYLRIRPTSPSDALRLDAVGVRSCLRVITYIMQDQRRCHASSIASKPCHIALLNVSLCVHEKSHKGVCCRVHECVCRRSHQDIGKDLTLCLASMAHMWDPPRTHIWDHLRTLSTRTLMWDPVRTLMRDPVRTLMRDPVRTLMWDPVRTLMWDPVRTLMWDPVRTLMW